MIDFDFIGEDFYMSVVEFGSKKQLKRRFRTPQSSKNRHALPANEANGQSVIGGCR